MTAPIREDVLTTDVGEAEDLLGHLYRRGRIPDRRQPFRFRQSVRGDERAVLARFEISSWAEVGVDVDGMIAVGLVAAGDFRASSNGLRLDPCGPFVLRPGEGRSQSEGLDLTMANLSLHALEAMGGFAPGSIVFPEVAPVSSTAATAWTRALHLVARVHDDDALLHNDLLRGAAVDTLLAVTLSTFPVEGRLSGADRVRPAPRAVRRALAHIEEHAAEPIGPVEIAAAAGLSVRTLHAVFRREVGATPVEVLRGVRLERVRAELAGPGPVDVSVADVARRWGFAHLGRFAATYRARFGELPSETLRR